MVESTCSWEDGECVGDLVAKCECGEKVSFGDVAHHGQTQNCKKCGQVYRLVWVGMTVVKEDPSDG